MRPLIAGWDVVGDLRVAELQVEGAVVLGQRAELVQYREKLGLWIVGVPAQGIAAVCKETSRGVMGENFGPHDPWNKHR